MKVAFIVIGNEPQFRKLVSKKYSDIEWHIVSEKGKEISKDTYYKRANSAARVAAMNYLVYVICNDHPVLTAMVISKIHNVRKSYRILEKVDNQTFRALKIP